MEHAAPGNVCGSNDLYNSKIALCAKIKLQKLMHAAIVSSVSFSSLVFTHYKSNIKIIL